jgi:DNA-directed RNA polymerase specialized sigma24 family protein
MPSRFDTTRWSLVRNAARDDPSGRLALDELCCIYRPAVLAFLRRRGMNRDAAEESTQSFFLHLLERELAARADPARGRFRVFLRTALENHLSHRREHDDAQRRRAPGGWVAFDDHDSTCDANTTASPEQAFDTAWALTMLERAMQRLRAEFVARDAADEFDRLRPGLTEGLEAGEARELGESLGIGANAVAARLHRLRIRLRAAVRLELAETVDTASDAEHELRHLRGLLGARQGGGD